MIRLLLALVLAMVSTTWSQSGEYYGSTVDESGAPLSGVIVTINGGTTDETGLDGSFYLKTSESAISTIGNSLVSGSRVSFRNGRVSFSVRENSSPVKIIIYNTRGQLCKEVLSRNLLKGDYNYSIENENIASGLFVLKVSIGNETHALKFLSKGNLSASNTFSVIQAKTRSEAFFGRIRKDTLKFELQGYVTVDTIISHSSDFSDSLHIVMVAESNGDLPQSFVKRAIMEEATGYWCGYCPYGAKAMKDFTEQYGDKFIGIAIHTGDVSQITKGKDVSSAIMLGASGVPDANIDRTGSVYPTSAGSNVSSELAKTAKCGLAIDATIEGKVTVTAGFLEEVSGAKLTVCLIENKIPDSGEYSQHDYDGVKWSGYTNDHVLTIIMTEALGDDIDGTKGSIVTKKYNYDKTKLVTGKSENAEIVAFINRGSSYIENAQEVTVGSKKDYNE